MLFADSGLTKRDLAEYYSAVAGVMLPYLTDRPISMQRFPDGVAGPGFYEKATPAHFPDWLDTAVVDTAEGLQSQVVVNSAKALVYLANQACITPHTWLSRTKALDMPDQLIFDLDPSVDDIALVQRATTVFGEFLHELGLTSWVKTSGSRGFHIMVPLRPTENFNRTRTFAREVAETVAERVPRLLTVQQRRDQRGSRVYVDIMRNAYAQTVVPPYAVRARPGAPVSTPIEWYEVDSVTPDEYTMASVRARLSRRGDAWHGVRRRGQGLTKARHRLARVRGDVH